MKRLRVHVQYNTLYCLLLSRLDFGSSRRCLFLASYEGERCLRGGLRLRLMGLRLRLKGLRLRLLLCRAWEEVLSRAEDAG